MRLDKFKLENFRKFKDLSLDLKPGVNILIGENAAGKTSILEALTILLGSYFYGINSRFANSPSIHKTKDVTFSQNELGQFDRLYPTRLTAEGEIFNSSIEWNRELNSAKGKTTVKGLADLRKIIKNNLSQTLPIITYYSISRLQPTSMDSSSYQKDERFEAYELALNAKASVKKFIKWFENEDRISYQEKQDTYALTVVSKAIKSCIPNTKRVYYDAKLSEIIIENIHKEKTLFSLMSDGYRIITSLIGDLAYRCAVLNAHLGEHCLNKTNGIVLIDEIETHLHPSWQERVINDLQSVFPKIQFIISTHSPIVLSATKANVIHLDYLQNGKEQQKVYTYGRKTEYIMYSEQGVVGRPPVIQEQINRFYELIDSTVEELSEEKLSKAKRILEELFIAQFGEKDPDTVRAKSDYEFAEMEFKGEF